MQLQIEKVILWSRRPGFRPRIVEFQPGVVNVISGASQTGKSALIPIVDYCLGSERCAIPVGTIRNACSWFGVLVATARGQVLLARREPGTQASTDEMYMIEGKTVKIPVAIADSNANRDFVKHYFDELAGMTGLAMVEGGANFQGRPSFRDLAAFNFQPQNIIANPQVLFFKADSTKHREKLMNVMPYALGITTPDVIAKQAELAEKRREQSRLRRELDSLKQTADQWKTQLRMNLSLAKEFGLVSPDTDLNVSEERAIGLLSAIIHQADQKTKVSGFTPAPVSLESSANQVVSLRQQEQEIAFTLSSYRRRMVEMSKLRDAAESYSAALGIEEDRLGIARWFLERADEVEGHCPVCGNDFDSTHSHLSELVTNLEEVEKGSATFRSLPPSFDKEWAAVRQQVSQFATELASVQQQIAALQEVDEAERQKRYTELNTSRFVGKLEAGLALYRRASSDAELRKKLETLGEEITALASQVDENAIQARRRTALNAVSGMMTPFLEALSVEGATDPTELVISDLGLRINRSDRKDFLWEIGSASNWLGYHLALVVALQQYFISLPSNPVPTFLMLDQPSQVYFPQKLAGSRKATDLDPKLADEDREKVKQIFRQLGATVALTNGRLQTIVVDHATQEIWGGLKGIHKVDDWRGDHKLVPSEWISSTGRAQAAKA